LKVSVEGEA